MDYPDKRQRLQYSLPPSHLGSQSGANYLPASNEAHEKEDNAEIQTQISFLPIVAKSAETGSSSTHTTQGAKRGEYLQYQTIAHF
jgi:hypothetical protein